MKIPFISASASASCIMRRPLMFSTTTNQSSTPTTSAPLRLIAVCVSVCIYTRSLTQSICVFIPCFACQQGCLPLALDESFRHAPADIDHGRDPPCSLQLLSGIWLCYRLNSLHELCFYCSHPNALVSFFYEAPSQGEMAVASSVCPITISESYCRCLLFTQP